MEKTVFSALFYYEKKTPVDHFRVGGQGGKLINRRKGGGNGSKRWSAPLSVSLTNSNLVITFVDEIYYETYRMWKSGTCYGNSKGIGNTCPLRHYYLPRFENGSMSSMAVIRDVPVLPARPATHLGGISFSPPSSPVRVEVMFPLRQFVGLCQTKDVTWWGNPVPLNINLLSTSGGATDSDGGEDAAGRRNWGREEVGGGEGRGSY